MNGAQALFKALTDAGLDTCFANPSTSEMQLVYEIGTTKGVRAVLCLQENTVTGAADGYARMAGKPAITAEEFHQRFAAAMSSKGPHLIEAQIAVTIQPMVDQILKERRLSRP